MLIVNDMHAYLFVGQSIDNFQSAIDGLAKDLHAKVMDFPITKIEDTRSLNNLIRLSFDTPTLITCQNINEATEEALNAFLKNLEEPQDNIYFALSAPTARKVLPTIVSRCQIIRSIDNKDSTIKNSEVEKFLSMSTGEKLTYIDKIKDRDEAYNLVENTVQSLHGKLHSDTVKYKVVAENLEAAIQTLTRLKANGNVNLQLTNFVINLV